MQRAVELLEMIRQLCTFHRQLIKLLNRGQIVRMGVKVQIQFHQHEIQCLQFLQHCVKLRIAMRFGCRTHDITVLYPIWIHTDCTKRAKASRVSRLLPD